MDHPAMVAVTEPSRAATGSSSAGDPYLPSSGNSGYRVVHYDLTLDYRVETNRLLGSAIVTARATERLERFSLDLAGLVIERVTVGGEKPKKVSQTARKLVITLFSPIEAGQTFETTVRYRGSPHPIRSPWGEVGWEELADGVLVASQPNGASSWFPCNDHPSNKATYRIAVSCEPQYAVISNGRQVSRTGRSNAAVWVFEVSEPMATYLATIQIGRYKTIVVDDAPVETTISFPPQLATAVSTDFSRVGEMIALYSALFGPYPFDRYAIVVTADVLEIPLEAHNVAIFGRNHVDGFHGSDRLIAHELAHQWFGNSLTVTRWQDIWLHEGFACYAEWLWSEHSGGLSADAQAGIHRTLLETQPKDIVVGDPGTKLLFDDRVYKRGALALHAVRRTIGDEAFFAALRDLTARKRFGGITPFDVTEAFIASAGSDAADEVIRRWIYRKSIPKPAR